MSAPVDHAKYLYAPIYKVYGIIAAAVTDDGVTYSLTIIPKVSGVLIGFSGHSRGYSIDSKSSELAVNTMKPAAAARMTELTSLGIAPSDLTDGTLSFGGKSWDITGYAFKPGLAGEAAGEVYFLLQEPNAP